MLPPTFIFIMENPLFTAANASSAMISGLLMLIVTSEIIFFPAPPSSLHTGSPKDFPHISCSAISTAALALVLCNNTPSRISRLASRSPQSLPNNCGAITSFIAPVIEPTVSPVTLAVGGAEPQPTMPESVSILTITSVRTLTLLTAVLNGVLNGDNKTPVLKDFILTYLFLYITKKHSISTPAMYTHVMAGNEMTRLIFD